MTSIDECREKFPDDPQIADEVRLLRRIPPRHFYYDENRASCRPSSAAFEDDEDGDPMSVFRQDVIEGEGDDPDRVMIGHEGFALVSLSAGQLRSKDQTLFTAPVPGESSHAKVCGPKSKSTRRWFARNATWVVEPPVGSGGR